MTSSRVRPVDPLPLSTSSVPSAQGFFELDTWRTVIRERQCAICPRCRWDWPTSYRHCPDCATSLEQRARSLIETWLVPDRRPAHEAHCEPIEWTRVWKALPGTFRGPVVEHVSMISILMSTPNAITTSVGGRPVMRQLLHLLRAENALLVANPASTPGLTAVLPPDGDVTGCAVRAVHLALDARQVIDGAGMSGEPFQRRGFIGVHTGPVALYRRAEDEAPQCAGGVLAFTPLLARSVHPTGVVASEAAYRLVRVGFEGYASMPLDAEPHRASSAVYAVRAPKPTVSWRDLWAGRSVTLRGRNAELDGLRRRWVKARESLGGIVELVAEPGTGKSALLEAFVGQLAETNPDARIVRGWGACYGGSAFQLVWQVLREANWPVEVSRLSIEAATRLLVESVASLAEQAPLAVILDDLHWADHESLAALTGALAHWRSARALVVLSYRPSLRERVMLPVTADDTSIEVSPLGASAVGQVLADVGSDLSERAREAVAARAAGNPLYLEEAAALLGELGAPTGSDFAAALPPTLPELILKRIDLWADRDLMRLERFSGAPSPTAGAVNEIAVAERRIGDWVDRIETGAYLDRFEAARLLWRLVDVDRRLRVLRWSSGMSLPRRGRLGEALERLYAGSTAELCAAIEEHAEDSGDADGALWQALRAAEHAQLRDDDWAVVKFGRLARSLQRRGAVPVGGWSGQSLLQMLARALERVGLLREAESLYIGESEGDAVEDALGLARAAWLACCQDHPYRGFRHLCRAREIRRGLLATERVDAIADRDMLSVLDAHLAAASASIRMCWGDIGAGLHVHDAMVCADASGSDDLARELSLLQLQLYATVADTHAWNVALSDLLARWDRDMGDAARARLDLALARAPLPAWEERDSTVELAGRYTERASRTS
jgi:hypothetical protein